MTLNSTLSSSPEFPSAGFVSISEFLDFKRGVFHYVLLGIAVVTAMAILGLSLTVSRKIYRSWTIDEEVPEPVKIYTAAVNHNIHILIWLEVCLLSIVLTFHSKRRQEDGTGQAFTSFLIVFFTMSFQAWNLWSFSQNYAPTRDEAIELNNYPPPVPAAQGCEQEQGMAPAPPYAACLHRPL